MYVSLFSQVALRCRTLNVILGGLSYPNLQLLNGPQNLYYVESVSAFYDHCRMLCIASQLLCLTHRHAQWLTCTKWTRVAVMLPRHCSGLSSGCTLKLRIQQRCSIKCLRAPAADLRTVASHLDKPYCTPMSASCPLCFSCACPCR